MESGSPRSMSTWPPCTARRSPTLICSRCWTACAHSTSSPPLGGGTQERLGLYLKQHLAYRPAIHCIGAAIAFLSGDQVDIPVWGDRFYLGWLFRCLSDPKRFVPRYWGARKLIALMWRYRDRLPELRGA